MKRINVTFSNQMYETLAQRAEKNGSNSIANEIRDLVDLGLKIEEAAQKNGDNTLDAGTQKLLDLIKNNLVWSLETRLLTRYLVESLPESENEDNLDILKKYKEKAKNYVEGLLGDEDE